MEELEIVSYDWFVKSFDTVMHKANLVIPVDDDPDIPEAFLKELDMWNVYQNRDIVADPEAYFSSLNWLLTQQKPNLGTRGT
jgi:hypothetical protein